MFSEAKLKCVIIGNIFSINLIITTERRQKERKTHTPEKLPKNLKKENTGKEKSLANGLEK